MSHAPRNKNAAVPPPSRRAAYQDLFDRMKDSTFLVDPTSLIVLEANPAVENHLGLPADDFQGRAITQWIEPGDRDPFEKALRVAMRRYHPRLFECQWRNDKGEPVFMEVLACPLKLSDGTEVLQLIARDVTSRIKQERKLLDALIELSLAHKQLEALSIQDAMTGLHNYRHFQSQLHQEHVRAKRYETPYSLVYIDVDHFKHYNDRNGHPAGDELLRELGKILKKCCRDTDIPTRYGGEEFAVICPGVNPEGAQVLAERIRTSVEAYSFKYREHQPLGKVTVSIGVAGFPVNGAGHEAVLKAADEALYQSKTAGRNRVTLSSAKVRKAA